MRRIVVFDRVSADGYFAASDGGLDWTAPDPELDRGVAGMLGAPGTILLGRKTYQMFASFWPRIDEAPATAPGPHERQITAEHRAMAARLNASTEALEARSSSGAVARS